MKEETEKYISEWKAKDEDELAEIKVFLASIYQRSSGITYNDINETHSSVFAGIDCLQCGNCCKTTPPIYTKKDIKRIAQFLKTTPSQFKRKYTIEDVNGELVGIRVPCSFLNNDNTCNIYEVRPVACRTYPHTDDPDFHLRSELNYNNTLICPAAYAICKKLMVNTED